MENNKLIQTLEDANIKVHDVNVPEDAFENSFEFGTLEEYLAFLKDANINIVFYNKCYVDKEDYIIEEDMYEDDLEDYPKDIQKEIVKKIEEYNKSVEKIDFEMPAEINLFAIYEGAYFKYVDEENSIAELLEELDVPGNKIFDIFEEYSDFFIKRKKGKNKNKVEVFIEEE